jgi:hypothetical protein
VHEPANREMRAKIAIEFLDDAVGHLRAQHDPRAALMGLQLIKRAPYSSVYNAAGSFASATFGSGIVVSSR